MAIRAQRRRTATTPAEAAPLPIGQEEQDIFNCPICSRPLARGARKCPGCGTRLVASVRMSLAGGFVAAGLIVGLIIGGGAVAGYGAITSGHAPARPSAAQSTAPSPGAVGGGTATQAPRPTSSPGAGSAISALAGSSLQQAGIVNVKLAEGAAALHAGLADSNFDAAGAAATLRSIAANASFGTELAPKVGGWDQAVSLSSDLGLFYDAVRTTARRGLVSSVTNPAAYKQASRDMIHVLGGLVALDREAHALAQTANIVLPELPAIAP